MVTIGFGVADTVGIHGVSSGVFGTRITQTFFKFIAMLDCVALGFKVRLELIITNTIMRLLRLALRIGDT